MIELLKSRIADIEKAIAELVANHTSLMVRLDEAKYVLDMATKSLEAVAPESPVVESLKVVDSVVDAVDVDVHVAVASPQPQSV